MKLSSIANVIFLASLFTVSSFADLANDKYDVNCTADLTYSSPNPADKPFTISKSSGPVNLMDVPKVQLDFGPFTLNGLLMVMGPNEKEMEETFEILLHKGNPVTGQINFARAHGLHLPDKAKFEPVHLSGMNFLSFEHKGKKISRVDYQCSVMRLE